MNPAGPRLVSRLFLFGCNTGGRLFLSRRQGAAKPLEWHSLVQKGKKSGRFVSWTQGCPTELWAYSEKKWLWGEELAVTLWHVNGRVKSEHDFQGRSSSSSSGKLQISVRTESKWILCCLLMSWCLFLRLFLWMKGNNWVLRSSGSSFRTN